MPHWYGLIDTSSPPILDSCNGDPRCVRERIMANAPYGANVRSIVWLLGENRARVTVEGPAPAALDYLEKTLEAQDIVELEVSGPDR